jgi:hypothetical protein
VGSEACHSDHADRGSVAMDYFIDRRINLSAQARACKFHSAAVRHNLMAFGLNFAEANQFALFAVYGFHGPTEKQTLNMKNKIRLAILDDYQPGRKKDPPAWNRCP